MKSLLGTSECYLNETTKQFAHQPAWLPSRLITLTGKTYGVLQKVQAAAGHHTAEATCVTSRHGVSYRTRRKPGGREEAWVVLFAWGWLDGIHVCACACVPRSRMHVWRVA